MFRPIACTFACATLLVGAYAAPPSNDPHANPKIAVDYSDLNLSHEAGANALLGRIKAAAKIVCGTHADNRDLARFMAHRKCAAQATDDAVASLRHPVVAKVHGKPELAANPPPKMREADVNEKTDVD